jgi:hypothetical protein
LVATQLLAAKSFSAGLSQLVPVLPFDKVRVLATAAGVPDLLQNRHHTFDVRELTR